MENNLFMDALKDANNFDYTENGAITHKTTKSKVYDMFALGGAYRNRSDEDAILLFKNAYEENATLAVKCLFYLRDIRGGQGERRFFRVCFRWLCEKHPEHARKLVPLLPEYGRYDDLWYTTYNTECFRNAMAIVEDQFALDLDSKTPSLLAKWIPSENTSSYTTVQMARVIRKRLGYSKKDYRKALSLLRARINVLETLMSANRWDEIEFDKIPSRAGLLYKNAFARRDILAKRYESFIKSETTTVNADTLYPYEIVAKATKLFNNRMDSIERAAVEKYWNNLPNYLENGKMNSFLAMVDTSGSMTGYEASAPINIAISLGIYGAERANGAFKNHYISFSSRPQLIEIKGVDFVDKVKRIYQTNLCQNTDLVAAFDMLKNIALNNPAAAKDMPDTIIVISDMEIDYGTRQVSWGSSYGHTRTGFTMENAATEMEKLRAGWERVGLKLPRLVYWNVDARENHILDSGSNVTFVSGMSPVIFESIIKGITGYDLMLDKLMSARYEQIV